MKKSFLLALFCQLFIFSAFAQKNNIYAELGGVSGHISLNYERMLLERYNWRIYSGIGFSPGLFSDKDFSPRIPIQVKGNYKIKKFEIELGVSFSPYLWTNQNNDDDFQLKDFSIAWFAKLGFRYNIFNNRINLGLYYSPLIIDDNEKDYMHWGAFCLGYKF